MIDQIMRDLADKIFAASQENIMKDGITDRGTLIRSGEIVEKGGEVIIGYSAPHASAIESGRTPGIPVPIKPIIGWVRRKLGIKDHKEAKKVAWAVATSIKTHGTEPRFFMKKAIESVRGKV